YPELIAEEDEELLLVRREQPIADSLNGSGRWALDHLFVTRDAVPILVEVKRATDTRLRREVIGQLLEYAANASAYWTPEIIAESYEQTAIASRQDPEATLQRFIGDQEPEAFWAAVHNSCKVGQVKLVIVADQIPRELALMVEFLNDQMRAGVRAIELKWFAGDDGLLTLSPRIIGQTEKTAAAKRSSATARM